MEVAANESNSNFEELLQPVDNLSLESDSDVNKPLFDEESDVEETLKGRQVVHNVNLSNRGTPILIENEKDKESESSVESKVWQMMLANSNSKFKVSPPVFNTFKQEKKHWLERPPISWKRVDNSRIKCEKWLDDVIYQVSMAPPRKYSVEVIPYCEVNNN
ncbi:hypothetical protein NQ314_009093 [Rhamnusium bicolor]|uniref:Uncharacterized protein n=1 Tax=Rhamnusium bicolor TaxID=1586634 RepID=A0AAV8Y2W9_9CUCU|nr:hypothetical protein NQ314_009093 [Rhamnusium bicolor]